MKRKIEKKTPWRKMEEKEKIKKHLLYSLILSFTYPKKMKSEEEKKEDKIGRKENKNKEEKIKEEKKHSIYSYIYLYLCLPFPASLPTPGHLLRAPSSHLPLTCCPVGAASRLGAAAPENRLFVSSRSILPSVFLQL